VSNGELGFIASLLRGAATLAIGPPRGSARRAMRMKVGVNAASLTATRDIELQGPGEVTGLDARTVIRTWPAAGVGDAAPNDMAVVEFDQADLPWRYSMRPLVEVRSPPLPDSRVAVTTGSDPTSARATFSSGSGPSTTNNDDYGRLHPWIVLIVLKPDEIVSYTPPSEGRPLPVLQVKVKLPDLAQSWAWAHAQVTGTSSLTWPEALKRFETAPHTLISRLICPRRLEPRVPYRAFVVPSYERGRIRGLGGDPDVLKIPADQRSWTQFLGVPRSSSVPRTAADRGTAEELPDASLAVDEIVELPVYFEWEFQTATAGSDFESLVRRLTPIALPPAVGTRTIDATAVDASLPPASAQPLPIGGALRNPNTPPPAWNAAERATFVAAMTAAVNKPTDLLVTAGTPQVPPPMYGRWHAADDRVGDATPRPWLDDVNRDARNRIAAGAGGAVVEKQEEKLLTAAWQQIDGLPAINEKLRFAQLSRVLAFRVRQRSLVSAPTLDAFLAVTAPAFARVRAAGTTVASQLDASRLGRGPLEPAFRRLTRPFGPLGARMRRINASSLTQLLNVMNNGQRVRVPPAGTLSVLALNNAGSAAMVTSAPLRPNFTFANVGHVSPPPAQPAVTIGAADSLSAADFRAEMTGILQSMRAPRPQLPALVALALAPLRATLTTALDPAKSVAASLAKRLQFAPGFRRDANDPLDPVLAWPSFDHPMYEPLRDVSAEWILPSLGDVPNNSVSLAAVNPSFVESFMAGLNHEFARSLLWRRYPTDQRGTFFRQFWDSRAYFGPHTLDDLRDVHPLDQWLGAHGANSPRPPMPNGEDPLVLVIHGDLLQQFPRTVVYAARAETVNGLKQPVEPPDELHPIFRGTLPGSFAFFGFELTADQARGDSANPDGWFFVLQEQPTEPRFGFDAASPLATPKKWADLAWDHIGGAASPFIDLAHASPDTSAIVPQPGEEPVAWTEAEGTTSAQLAYIALRRTPRIAIHAVDMLGSGGP
jgi:hypothetical protein